MISKAYTKTKIRSTEKWGALITKKNARPETTGSTRSTQSDSRRNSIRNSISAAERQATRPVPKRDVDKTMDGLGSIGNMLPSPINQFIKDLRSNMPNLSVGIGASFGKRGQTREPERQSRRQQNFDRRQDLSERRPRKTMNSLTSRTPDPLIDLRDPFPVENRNTRQFIDKVEPRFDNNRNRLPDFTSGFGLDNQNQQSDPWTQSGNFMDRFAPEPTFLLSGGKQPAAPPSTSSMSSQTNSNSPNRITQDQSLNSNRGMLPNNNNQLVAPQNIMTNSQGQGNQGVRQGQMVSGQNTMTNNQVQGNQGQLVTGQNTMTNNMQMQGMMTNNRNNLLQGQNLINNMPQQTAGSQGQTFNQGSNLQGNTQNMNQMVNQQKQVPMAQNSPVNQMVLQQNQNKLPGFQQQQIQSQSNALTTSLMNGQIQNNMNMAPPVNTILSQGQIQQNSGGQMGTGLNVQNLNQIQGQNTIQSNNQFQQGQIQQQQTQQANNQNQVQNQQTLLTSLLQQLLVQLNDGQSGSNTINSVPRKTLNPQQNINQLPNTGQSMSNNQQNNLLLGLNAKNNVQPLQQQQQTILNNQQVVGQKAQSQSNSILQALLGIQGSSPMTSISTSNQGQQQSKTNGILPVNNNVIGNGNTGTLQANPEINNLLKQLGLNGNNVNQLNQGTNRVSNTVTKQQTLPQPPPVTPVQGNQETINLLKQLGLTGNQLANLLNQGTQQKQTLSTNQQIQPLIQQTQAVPTNQLTQPVNQQMQQSIQQTQTVSTNQQIQPLIQQSQAIPTNQQMQQPNQQTQTVSANQQTQPLNRQMQPLNQQIQPLNQQMQPLNQQTQPLNQQMQPVKPANTTS
ncbi:unnamed protein product [Mytilus edulis]|uniref:Uncharacterized protein n=1 Tax=Mytilus edulis TaxID=6550 RepID=A0A8S3ULK3_MYTED|nr:unnamed protein product [Mytilus edulis]